MHHSQELPVPLAAKSDQSARELLRVWAANGQQEIVLAADTWNDPAAWGIMLVDLARHIANAYNQRSPEYQYENALARIKSGFDTEWEEPTDTI